MNDAAHLYVKLVLKKKKKKAKTTFAIKNSAGFLFFLLLHKHIQNDFKLCVDFERHEKIRVYEGSSTFSDFIIN